MPLHCKLYTRHYYRSIDKSFRFYHFVPITFYFLISFVILIKSHHRFSCVLGRSRQLTLLLLCMHNSNITLFLQKQAYIYKYTFSIYECHPPCITFDITLINNNENKKITTRNPKSVLSNVGQNNCKLVRAFIIGIIVTTALTVGRVQLPGFLVQHPRQLTEVCLPHSGCPYFHFSLAAINIYSTVLLQVIFISLHTHS